MGICVQGGKLSVRNSIAAVVLALAPGIAFAQPTATEPIKTTLCELVKTPEQFNGKMVQFRAEYLSKFQWEGFVDESCSAKIQVSAYGVFDDIRAQDGQTHLPVHPKHDDNYRAFRKYAGTKFRWPDGGRCQDCPLYRIIVTADGRFDYFAGQTIVVKANPAEKAVGVSDGDLPLLRFALQSISDVVATPIDPSIYSAKKRRDLTLEEAHELVKAFQKDHGEGGNGLEKYEVKEYPGFQFFQAVPDPPSGRIHYAVDRRTGDVWDAVICDHLTSRSLAKLLIAIRKRIGLTEEVYRNLHRDGPMCEPGMPRLGTGK